MPRTANVSATSDVTALRVSKEAFAEFLITFPTMGVAMMRELGFRLSRTTAELVAERRHAHA